jgi:hypothetical protein
MVWQSVVRVFQAVAATYAKYKTYIDFAAFVITVGTGVKAYRQGQELLSKGQAILGQKTAQGGKIPVIYGRRRVGSTLAFLHTHDGRSKDLFVVYALSVGVVDEIELDTIEINGVSIKDTKVFRQGYYAGSDKIASGAGSLCTASQVGRVQEENAKPKGTDPTKRYRMVFNAHHGASDQTVDPMLNASVPTEWTTNHRLRGVAYIAASFEYDSRGMFSSIPQLTVVVKGKKLYDPRKDGSISGGSGSHRYDIPSTFEWSDNAALCLLDYLRDDEYGKGLASSAVNLQSFQTAANTSDELEDTPDYSGTASSATFSGTSGNRFINVDSATWGRAKVGGVITIEDSGSATEFSEVDIVDSSRWQEYDATNPTYQVVVNDTLSSDYTDESGTALVKVRRFHCNGVVDTNKNVLENTQELLGNMRGILNYIDGKYEITLEDTASSTFTVTDDHIVSDNGITVSYENKSEKANKVVVQFFNALKKYEMDTVTVFHDATPNYKSDDGGEELELVVDFPYIVNKYVAYNMGEAILGRSRNQMTISFTGTPELYKVKVGDVITVAYTPVGFTGKLFRVEAMALQPNGLIDVQCIEYLDIYTWEAPPQENIEDIARIPAGFEVKAPTGLTFTDSNSSSTGRPFLSWNEPTDFPNYEYRVSIVDASSNKLLNKIVDDEFVDCNFLPVGSNYVASVSSINSVGSESDAATLTFSVSTEPVATADVKDSAITTGKINDSAVTTAKLVDAAITTVKIATDAVTNAKIAVDAIQGDVIAAGAITTTKIGANAVTTAKLANDAVTSDIIAAGAITATEISDGAISTPKLAAGAVTTAKLAAGSVTANEIAANTITAGQIATGAINTDELAANAVTAAKIAANTITASQIAAGTITATQIAADTITAANIAAGAIATSELAANAVTAAKIAANTITASEIASNTITASEIAANAITSSEISASAVTADKINVTTLSSITANVGTLTAGTIDASTLTINNINATNINTGTLSASRLNIDGITLENSGGQLIIKSGGVDTAQLATDAVETAKIAAKAVSSFTVATGGVGTWFTDNLSETDIVTTSVFQAPTNTDNDFAVLGNTTVVANSGSSTDFVQLRLYRRSASTSGGVSSASYVQIASYKMYGDSGEAIQTIADSDSYTADYYYQYKMTLQTQGTSQIGGQTRSYGTSLLQVFVTYR